MKKNIFVHTVMLLLAGAMFTGCSDFLQAENKSAGGSAEEYFNSNPEALLVSAYESMQNMATMVEINEDGTDLYINTRGKAAGVFNTYALTAGDGTVQSLYSNTYKTINYANGVIQYAGAESVEGHQARFLRAYCYYMLTQHFGGVPYITNYINDATTGYARTPLETVYQNVIADIEPLYNQSTLPDMSDHSGRASKQAVAALLAKLYLARAWDLGVGQTENQLLSGEYTVKSTADFDAARKWADNAIHGIPLDMSFEDKWAPGNDRNVEEIWSVQYERNGYPGDVATGGHSLQNAYGAYYGDGTNGVKNCGSTNCPSVKALYLFEKGDKRFDGTFMTTIYNWKGSSDYKTDGYYGYYNASARNSLNICARWFPWYVTEAEAEAELTANQSKYTKEGYNNSAKAAILSEFPVVYTIAANGTYTKSTPDFTTFNAQTWNGTCVKKYDDPDGGCSSKSDYRPIVMLHVSDMYLIAAEACLLANHKADAINYLKAVRTRAGFDPSENLSFENYKPSYSEKIADVTIASSGIDLILDERARELYAERQRWMDLRRTKQLVRYNVKYNTYVGDASAMKGATGYRLLRPIPANEISVNTEMTSADQNPGY